MNVNATFIEKKQLAAWSPTSPMALIDIALKLEENRAIQKTANYQLALLSQYRTPRVFPL